MASFLSGPAAQLVGAAMQGIGVGIPVGQTSAKVINGLRDCGLPVPPKNWFKRKDSDAKEPSPQQQQQQQQQQARDERSPRTIYDKLESHIHGVMQVVKPAIELKKLVRESCCKSAERPRRAASQSPGNKSIYYTPQKCASGGCKLFDDDQESPSAKRKAARKTRSCKKLRCDGGSSEEEEEEAHCVYCSRSRSLIKLPCGRLICPKCDETGDHESECKRCRAAEKSRVYC